MSLHISRIAKFALFIGILLLAPSVLTPQSVHPDYVVVWSKSHDWTSIGKILQEAADRGYRLVPSQDTWPVVVLEKSTGDVEPIEYLLLAGRAGVMQKKVDEASAQGYRFCTMLGYAFTIRGWSGIKAAYGAGDLLLAMQREKGKTTRTHEYKILATRRRKTMQEELNAEGQKGFRLVGQGDTGDEIRAVVERPLQSTPTTHEYLVPWSSLTGFDSSSVQKIADRGYRLIPGGGAWTDVPAFEKCTSNAEPIDYLFLPAERKVEKYQKRVDDASAQGYRFLAFVPEGIVMQREKGKSTRTHEQKILRVPKLENLEGDLLAGAQKGFRIAGMIGALVILERPD